VALWTPAMIVASRWFQQAVTWRGTAGASASMITAAIWSERWLPKPVGAGKTGFTRQPSGATISTQRMIPSLCGRSSSAIMKNAIITDESVTASGALT
jgi:hypothetical protein